jgi:hypothetical protein
MRATIEHGSASVHSPRPGPDTLSTQVRLTLEIVVTAHDASPPCAARWNYGAREGTSMDKGMRKDTTMWSSVWLRAGRGGRSFATWTGSNRVKSKFTTWRGGMRMTQREHRTTSTNPIRRDFVYQLFFFQSIVFKASSRPARHPHSPCRSTSSSRRGTRACKVPKRSRRTSPAGFCPSCTRPPPTPSCRRVKSRTSTLSLCRSFSQYTSPVGRDIPHCPARADCR